MSRDVARPRALPPLAALLFGAAVLLGVVAFGVGLSSDAPRTYRVFLHNWLLWAAISQGALVLSCAMHMTNARWQGPIHRLVDSMGAFVPVSLLLFFVIWLGRHDLFGWLDHGAHGKEWWLREGFFFGRDLAALLWITLVSVFYLYVSVRPMLGEAREGAKGLRRSLYRAWSAGWGGEARERDLAERRLRKLAVGLVLSYVAVYSLLGIDLVMSLSPEWVSAMFPAYYGWGGFLSAVSLATLIALVMRNGPDLSGEVTKKRMHDMGKMIFAFSIFWMYLFWSQYFIIYYGNVPEETGFIASRLGSQFLQDYWYMDQFFQRISEPYVKITLVAWILVWVVPFWVLLGQRPKQTPAILGTVALGSVVGFWLERYILVTPSIVTPEEVLAGAPITWYGAIELGVGIGFVGLFFLCFLTFGRVFPGLLPVSRPGSR